jgi:23S rRNA (cytidine2498-2'-O)-methyltransferase
LFSVATDSYDLAVREIREAFGPRVRVERVSGDLGRIAENGPSVEELAEACSSGRIIFVRHLTQELASFKPGEVPEAHELAELILEELPGHPRALSVQTWTDGAGTGGTYYHLLEEVLGTRGIAVNRAGQDVVVSCFVSSKSVILGLNQLEDSLSDWPGGRMRLARSDDRVSRSEFKLEEAIRTFGLDLGQGGDDPGNGPGPGGESQGGRSEGGRALDLGASPGGWTRILRQQGLEVWSVDPGDLDPRVTADRRVHHVKATAGNFFRGNQVKFDVVVNDMRMDQVMSARVMLDAVPHLRRGALAIVTLKGGGRNPLDSARRGIEVLSKEYDVLHARQLHHNRREITVIAERP